MVGSRWACAPRRDSGNLDGIVVVLRIRRSGGCEMGNLAEIGVFFAGFFGGLGVFFAGIGVLWGLALWRDRR